MIHSEFDPAARSGRIVLRPNQSWSWRANLIFLGSLMVISLTVAVFYLFNGYWLILPFTFVEQALLFACFYYVVRRTHRQEVLTFSPEALVVESGLREPDERYEFQRFFTRFLVRPAQHPWYRKQVALRCRDTELEIGSFLSADEKDDLVSSLRAMIAHFDSR